MCVVGERAHRRHGLLDRRPLALGQLGIGENRLAAKLAAKERLREPARGGPENSSSSACSTCSARSALAES